MAAVSPELVYLLLACCSLSNENDHAIVGSGLIAGLCESFRIIRVVFHRYRLPYHYEDMRTLAQEKKTASWAV